MSDELEREEGIVYLDPMEVEVDEYNARYDSPVDEDVIEMIKDDLRNGGEIEYPITVRVKGGRYYCYVGRNRLLAAKKYVKESGRRILIPAKIRNVDDLTALEMSLNENLMRKELSRSELSHGLKMLYEEWIEEKKYIKNMNQGIVVPREQKIGVGGKHIEDVEIGRGRPEDPFTVSKFIKENDIPLKRTEVIRLLAIDDLSLDVKRGLDEKDIDMLTAYELTKFDRGEQLNIYHYFRLFKKIPRDVRVKALKKYRDNPEQPFNILLIDEYRKYISSRYPVFNRLGDMQIADIAQNIGSGKLGRLAENLEYMINEGLKPEKLKLTHIKKLASLTRRELKRYSEYKRMLRNRAEQLGMRFYDGKLALSYLDKGEFALRREEGDINRWMKELKLKRPEEFRVKLRELSETARYEFNRIMRSLSTHPSEYADDLRKVLEKKDWVILRKTVNDIYKYLLESPGYIPKERSEDDKIRKGILYRLYRREYKVGEELIRKGLVNENLSDVEEGVKKIMDILERIEDMLDYNTQHSLFMRLNDLPIDMEIHDVNADEYSRFDGYILLMRKIDSFLELYVYIREYISSMDEYMRNARALEVKKLIGVYRGFMKTVRALKGEIQYSGMDKYISNAMSRDICRNVVKYIDLKNEVADSLAEIKGDINSIEKTVGNNAVSDQLWKKYKEYEDDFKDYTQRFDTYGIRGLELLRDHVNKFIEKYSREFGEILHKTATVKIEGYCKCKPIILIKKTDEGLKCEILSGADYSDEVEGELEYMGKRYKIVFKRDIHLECESIKKISRDNA